MRKLFALRRPLTLHSVTGLMLLSWGVLALTVIALFVYVGHVRTEANTADQQQIAQNRLLAHQNCLGIEDIRGIVRGLIQANLALAKERNGPTDSQRIMLYQHALAGPLKKKSCPPALPSG